MQFDVSFDVNNDLFVSNLRHEYGVNELLISIKFYMNWKE